MFDIGWSEMLVIAIVVIVVVGPKELPGMLRTFGKTTAKLRVMANDFRRQFDDAMKEAELDDVKKIADDVRKLNPAGEIKKALSPMEKAAQDVRAGLDAAMKPKVESGKQPESPAEPAAVAQAAAAVPAAKPATNGAAASVQEAPAPAPRAAKPAARAAKPAATASKAVPKPRAAAKRVAAAKPRNGGAGS